jgi:hypothetical protein
MRLALLNIIKCIITSNTIYIAEADQTHISAKAGHEHQYGPAVPKQHQALS